MNFNKESIQKYLEDRSQLIKRIEYLTERIQGDRHIDITDISLESDNLTVDYNYYCRGYSYCGGIDIPLYLLNSNDEEIDQYTKRFRDEYKRLRDEEARKEKEYKIKEEKALLKKLKDKYEKENT